jgi:hypothetical protein
MVVMAIRTMGTVIRTMVMAIRIMDMEIRIMDMVVLVDIILGIIHDRLSILGLGFLLPILGLFGKVLEVVLNADAEFSFVQDEEQM